MSILAQIVLAVVLFLTGFAGGIRWHVGQDAIADLAAREHREADTRQQRRLDDLQAGRHAGELATLNAKLGDARAHIARLSGRTCFDADTVGVLNSTGVPEPGAAAGEPARATAAASAAGGQRAASDVDAGEYIALCRTRYAELKGQLDRILDIEDRRHPPLPASPP